MKQKVVRVNPAVKENHFDQEVIRHTGISLYRDRAEILQVNLGKLCNLSCSHCHVEAGPTRIAENMNQQVADAVSKVMEWPDWKVLDLTGGAPEMSPHFKPLIRKARERQLRIIDRCNLTILDEIGYEDMIPFLAQNNVEIVASLPCYSSSNVDKQRGNGVFNASIKILKQLNATGYGRGNLRLHLVYNPVGPHLPPSQQKLELDYKQRLMDDFGIQFDSLFTITNMPIKRYRKYLSAKKELESYETLLSDSFNIGTLSGLMCRNTLSVSWDGQVYDCDFNQMMDIQMDVEGGTNIFNLDPSRLTGKRIQTAKHCFGCTAGAGSSCQGALEIA